MNTKSSVLSATILAAALLSQTSQAQTPATSGGSGTTKSASPSMSMPAGGMDMKAMMKENNEKMGAMPMTGKADVDFAMMMRMHHQGAIDMAQEELKNGKEPQMKKMAKDIIAAQKKEMAQFDNFLSKHGQPTEKMSK